MNDYITHKCKDNDAVIRVYIKDGIIDELMVQIDGEKSWVVIGFNSLQTALLKANKKISSKWNCDKCAHSFSNPFDQQYCMKDFDLENNFDCGGELFKRDKN